jgi:hypothetical protein
MNRSIVLAAVLLLGCGGGAFSAASDVSDSGTVADSQTDSGNPQTETGTGVESSLPPMPEASTQPEADAPETSPGKGGGDDGGDHQDSGNNHACCLGCAQQAATCVQQNCTDAGSSPACTGCYNQLSQCSDNCGGC